MFVSVGPVALRTASGTRRNSLSIVQGLRLAWRILNPGRARRPNALQPADGCPVAKLDADARSGGIGRDAISVARIDMLTGLCDRDRNRPQQC